MRGEAGVNLHRDFHFFIATFVNGYHSRDLPGYD